MMIQINGKQFPITRETKTCYVVNPKGGRDIFFGKTDMKEISHNVLAPLYDSWRLTRTPHQLSQFE